MSIHCEAPGGRRGGSCWNGDHVGPGKGELSGLRKQHAEQIDAVNMWRPLPEAIRRIVPPPLSLLEILQRTFHLASDLQWFHLKDSCRHSFFFSPPWLSGQSGGVTRWRRQSEFEEVNPAPAEQHNFVPVASPGSPLIS
ncbi:unnamed protein product [Pleuronectes platessa]|uniref:Uncharacterized protein n=1 Tax=Pleuronectes platessa TaxID=8262 RepID=A0A9N7VCK4_PLEPL|nr:unnamed protein product [Pleuronectes platessa]